MKDHSDEIIAVVFSPDCKLVVASAKKRNTRLWNVQIGSHRFKIEHTSHTKFSAREVAFSPDSRLLASGSENNVVRLWDTVTGQCQLNLEGHSRGLHIVRFSPNSELLASGSYDIMMVQYGSGMYKRAGVVLCLQDTPWPFRQMASCWR